MADGDAVTAAQFKDKGNALAGYKSKESGSHHANPPQASLAARAQAFHF